MNINSIFHYTIIGVPLSGLLFAKTRHLPRCHLYKLSQPPFWIAPESSLLILGICSPMHQGFWNLKLISFWGSFRNTAKMSAIPFTLPRAMDVPTVAKVVASITMIVVGALLYRIVYNIYFHPLPKFPGPWYAAATSITDALYSYNRQELPWFQSLVKKYGRKSPLPSQPPHPLLIPTFSADTPIRIAQTCFYFLVPRLWSLSTKIKIRIPKAESTIQSL